MTEEASTALLNAVAFAVDAHGAVRHARKGTSFPYVIHPIRVAEILYSFGLDEDVVIAGLLHDTTEDAGITLDQLEARFGARVRMAVEGASEPDKDACWKERKEHTIRYLRDTASPDVLAVAAADKLDNVRSLRETLLRRGEETWATFNAGRSEQRWYYRSVAETIRARDPSNPLFRTLDAESRILFHEGEIGTREQQRWEVEGNTYKIFIHLLHPEERKKLSQTELRFELDTREPWVRAHYGSNATEIGATLTARHPNTPVVVKNTDGSDDNFQGGYVIEVGENAGGDDGIDDWPPIWFLTACAKGGVRGLPEDTLRDLLPPGWGYKTGNVYRLTCPHGHTIELSADECPDGCRNPLTEWYETHVRKGEKRI